MEGIRFEGKIKVKYIKNIKAAYFVESLDFWFGLFGFAFFLVSTILSSESLSYYSIFFFGPFIILNIIAATYGGTYLIAYKQLKNEYKLYKEIGVIEKKKMFPFYMTISNIRYKSMHQLINYASQMGKTTSFYQNKYYGNVGDKVEIIHMHGYILKVEKISPSKK